MERGGRLVQYYVKVMRLFEQVSAPTLVVSIVTTATEITDKADPNCVRIQSSVQVQQCSILSSILDNILSM